MIQQPDPRRATVAAYDASAAAYAAATRDLPPAVRSGIERFAGLLGAGARVLEIGSGGGRDAALMEELGLRVRRTDVTPAFVTLLRDQGRDADLLDPLTDDLADPDGPYDGVWANASLLHVARDDLGTVLARLCRVTRTGGLLQFSVKEGDGEAWHTHGDVAGARHFTFWRAEPLHEVVGAAGWARVETEARIRGSREETWLVVRAVRP